MMWQCPERGDPHFYQNGTENAIRRSRICVNALKGATRISTDRFNSKDFFESHVSMP